MRVTVGILSLRVILVAGALLPTTAIPAGHYTPSTSAALESADPYLWLEETEGERALNWVRAQNQRTLAQLTKDPRYERYYRAALAIAEDKSRVPTGVLREGWVYNFWQDERHVKGIWRRARLNSYRTAAPDWDNLLDLDALAVAEQQKWVFKGATCPPSKVRRCMIALSDGGKNASVFREFDIESRSFVKNGFLVPEAKSAVVWKDDNTLLVATDWGPGTLTISGYPFIVRQWSRGEQLSPAREIHRGRAQDMGAWPQTVESDGGRDLLVVKGAHTIFSADYWMLDAKDQLLRMTLPSKAKLWAVHRGELVFTIAEDWSIGGTSWRSGALLSMPVEDVARPVPRVRPLTIPGPSESIVEVAGTAGGLLVAGSLNVRGRLLRFVFDGERWHGEPLQLPDNGVIALAMTEPSTNTAFAEYEDFLHPTTLYEIDVSARRAASVKALPELKAELLVPSVAPNRPLMGTACDYLLRF